MDDTYGFDIRQQNQFDFAQYDARVEQCFVEFRAEMQIGFHALATNLIRWMLAFSIAQTATTVGIVYGLLKVMGR